MHVSRSGERNETSPSQSAPSRTTRTRWPTDQLLSCVFGGRGRGGLCVVPLFLYILSACGLPFGVAAACAVDGGYWLLSFVLIRADALCNTLVCRDPPDIESRFELALGACFGANGTILGPGGGASMCS